MRPVEAIPGMGGGEEMKETDGESDFKHDNI
jgi:hypothetical protein